MLKAQGELHDHWLDCTRGRKRADSLKAARYAGLTSSRVLEPKPLVNRDTPHAVKSFEAQQLQIDSDVAPDEEEIPLFESFVMAGGGR